MSILLLNDKHNNFVLKATWVILIIIFFSVQRAHIHHHSMMALKQWPNIKCNNY